MPDFLLDTRPVDRRPSLDEMPAPTWSSRLRCRTWDRPEFRLTVTWTEPDGLWEPCTRPDGSRAAVVGFLALDEPEWAAAECERPSQADGGLAAWAAWQRYRHLGTEGWDPWSGNCAILLYDARTARLFVRTDPAGCFPVYGCWVGEHWIAGSHPDLLAAASERVNRLDEVSLAEFIMTSTVSPPRTYYDGIEGVAPGTVTTLNLHTGRLETRRYFTLDYQPDPDASVEDLADAFAQAWQTAVRRRTFPRLGRIAVALSGGLDSRLILGSMRDPSRASAFTCYDGPNRELATAELIARALNAGFHPIRRSPDYYGENAPAGVRISGGMGTFANNHFLGVIEPLQALGAQVLLTGCYCDYLFKGLPLNRRVRFWDGHETLGPFQHQFYFQHWPFDTPLARQAIERWEQRFPPQLHASSDEANLYRLEVLRTFPLYHEGDNQQRLVPQRLIPWSPPATDLGVLQVYRRIPSRHKLNRALFLRAARRLLVGSPLLRIPDANTGAALDAPAWWEALCWQWLRVRRWLRTRRSLVSDGSWPNWRFYYRHSPALQRYWAESAPEVEDFFRRVTGWKQLPRQPADFPEEQCFLFVALLTLKLWWRYRACCADSSNVASASVST
jgi:asparagine synthase (glutamine-hydrolysing)